MLLCKACYRYVISLVCVICVTIPEWKWDNVTMDFVSALPRTSSGYEVVWVVVDRLTKTAHFIPLKVGWSLEKLAHIYIKEIVRLHGVPVEIISD